jgi:adenine-specific DNA-methyltransferase
MSLDNRLMSTVIRRSRARPAVDLVEMAHHAGRAFTTTLTRTEQRSLGQFMTPPSIARFMAERLVGNLTARNVHVLEPSAGAGILAAAVIEALLIKTSPDGPHEIVLHLFEVDSRFIPGLRALSAAMRKQCRSAGVTLRCKIECGDFLLSKLARDGRPIDGLVTIANPPFLKLNKATDPRAAVHSYAVYGQPNLYALFMAATARLTGLGGRWSFITPRSWMNGAYFKAARRTILRYLTVDGLHAFDSRREGFEDDAVLQETVITWASERREFSHDSSILFTRSQGAADLATADIEAVPAERILGRDEDVMLALPTGATQAMTDWTATLGTYGLKVSTGPVVAFRAANHISENGERGTVPLLWLQHIGQQTVTWPIQKKREHIRATAATAWMLVPNEPMVIMRRFSPKEDLRRVTCVPYVGQLPGDVLGLENHLNYIYRPGGGLSPNQARGLAAYLASSLVDAHFRALAGSTQVNAGELRRLPLPAWSVIESIGRNYPTTFSLAAIDAVVNAALGLKSARRAI